MYCSVEALMHGGYEEDESGRLWLDLQAHVVVIRNNQILKISGAFQLSIVRIPID